MFELPAWLMLEWKGNDLWVLGVLPLCAIAAYLIGTMIAHVLNSLVGRIVKNRHRQFYQSFLKPLIPSVKLGVSAVIFTAMLRLLPLNEVWEKRAGQIAGAVATFAVVWALFKLITIAGDRMRDYFINQQKISAAATVPLMRKLAKAALGITALLFLMQNWGFDIVALLAGLGIGGIAVALASQKSVENLFGGVSITLDQPVRIGDLIRFEDDMGTVEDIGLRSTSIRTATRTRVVIPNSQFSEMKLENFTPRDKILMKKEFGVRYDTKPEQMRALIGRLEKYLEMHEKVEKGARVRFINFGASSLDLEIYLYVMTSDFNEFLFIQQEILINIMEIVQQQGLDFAFPSTSIYLEKALEDNANNIIKMRSSK